MLSVHNESNTSLLTSARQIPHPCSVITDTSRRWYASDEITKNSSISSDELTSAVVPTNESDEIIIPGSQTGGRKLAIVFTCNVCETRSAKQFTERSYTHGVVIVRCPGCDNLHLIADRLGYFGSDDFDLNSIVEQNGHSYKTVNNENVYEMSLEDLVGKDKMDELIREAEAAESRPEEQRS
jgi:hypothetical protein